MIKLGNHWEIMVKHVLIRCPSCSKQGRIDLADDSAKDAQKGLLAVNVAPNMICEHSFVAYLDKNLQARNYFIADFEIQIPETTTSQPSEASLQTSTDLIDLDLLRMNIPPAIITWITRAIFLKRNIVFISDQDFLYNHIQNFFKFITQNSFESKIIILPIVDYMKRKNDYKDFVVFGRNEILRDDDHLIETQKMKFENKIVEKFFAESELMSSLIILKNEFIKVYDSAKTIVEFLKNFDSSKAKKGEFTTKIILDHLAQNKGMKISSQYLNFLLEIVEHYFGVPLPDTSGVSDFLGFI